MPTLKAGAAKRIITPRGNLFLAGYGPVFLPWGHRKSTGVHDDIYARCLALSDDQTTLAFVALDFISFSQSDMEAIRSRAQRKAPRTASGLPTASYTWSKPPRMIRLPNMPLRRWPPVRRDTSL